MTQLTDGSLVSDFEYDDNSNLTKVQLNGTDNETFEYDIRNQLSKYTSIGNGITADYDYDFERKRLSKTVSGNRRDYVYAGNQVINEYLADNLNASYGIGSGEIISSDFVNEGTRNYFSDALGSITSLADSSSSLISRNDYDSFGEIVASSGISQNAVTYTGQRLDVESGLMALGNGERYYNPSYGRFIQQDRFAGLPQMPQSLNRFSYTHNNPTKYTDPSGNVIPLIPIVVGALAFAGAFLIGVTVVENEKIVRERNEEFIKQGVDSSTLPNSTATAVFNSAPVIGSGFKAYFGQDTITGEDLNWFWRAVEGASTILDALPVLSRAKGLRNAPRLFKAKEFAKQSDEIIDEGLDIARNVSRTEDGAEKVAESAKSWEDFLPQAQKMKEQTRQKYGFSEVSDEVTLMASRKGILPSESNPLTLIDNNILAHASRGDKNAINFLKNTGGLRIDSNVVREFRAGAKASVPNRSADSLRKLMQQYDIKLIKSASSNEASQITKIRGGVKVFTDDKIVATAKKHGIRFATGDKRALVTSIKNGVDTRFYNFSEGNTGVRYLGAIRSLKSNGFDARDYLGPLNPF